MTVSNFMQPSILRENESNPSVKLVGEWTLTHYTQLESLLQQLVSRSATKHWHIDFSALTQLDTAGCQLIIEYLSAESVKAACDTNSTDLPTERKKLLLTVVEAVAQTSDSQQTLNQTSFLSNLLANLGKQVSELSKHSLEVIAFIGLTLSTVAQIVLKPKRWRMTSLVAHLQQTGFNALPIVALLTFLIGAVVAFLGATLLTKFGANIYTVHLVSFSFLREFGPLLAAIIVAGRTASAFTAQIGSMRAHEEIDAIRVLGLNAVELLVIPRLLALLIALPLLTFLAMMSGILGGMLVSQATLDISFTMFLSVLQQNIGINHFWVGMAKAPFFAFIIVMISCLEGFKVSGSAQSVGEHTTSSVVQSIFMVIVIDAIFAIVCMEMGW